MNKKSLLITFTVLIVMLIFVNGYFYFNKTITLNFYSHPDKLGFLQDAISEFENQNRNTKINLVQLPDNTNEKYEIISSTLSLKDGRIDIVDSDVTWPAIFVNAGWVEPLNDYFTDEELNEYLSSAIDSATINNKLYGIPYRIDSGMLYYRKDLLDKYSISPPTTWNELILASQTIIEGEGREELYGYAGSWYQFEGLTCNYLEFLWGRGGNILDDDNNLLIEEKYKALEALQTMTDMIYKTKITPLDVSSYKSGDVRNQFLDGNLIFMRDWPAGWRVVNTPESSVKGLVEVTELPHFDTYDKSHGTYGGWLYMVSSSSNYKEESINFVKFLTNFEQEKNNALLYNYLPSRKALYEDEEVLKNMPYLQTMLPYFNEAKPRPRVHNYDIISYILQEEVTNALKKNKTPVLAVESIYKRISEILNN